MNSKTTSKATLLMLTVAITCVAFTLSMSAQVQTQTDTTTHAATVETTIERGEIVYLNGNQMIVKMEDGTLRHFANVPDSARAIVDGKEISIHDAKVGMKLEKTVITTSTPKTITTVQTVTGKVWHVTPPNSVILTLDDGTHQQFNIPKGQKFNVDGQMVDAWGLKKGMKVSATKVTEVPETDVEQKRLLTGSMPPPPPPDEPILVAAATPPPAPAAPTSAPAELPKTGSSMPLLGLLGCGLVGAGLGLKVLRVIG